MFISDAITNYLIAKNLREESLKPKKFYVSDMGKCHRMRFLKRKGIVSKFGPNVYWTFEMGNMVHNFGYDALRAQGLLLQTEQALETEHFSGRYDGKVRTPEGKKLLFDFKSVGEYPFKKAVAGADNIENLKQILTYVILENDPELERAGALVYFSKEAKGELFVFAREYPLDEMMEKEIKEEMNLMLDYWLNSKIPACTCPGWMRDYNPFQPLCDAPVLKVQEILERVNNGEKIITTNTKVTVQEGNEEKEITL